MARAELARCVLTHEAVAKLVSEGLSKRSGVETDLIDIGALPLRTDDAGEAVKHNVFSSKMERADGLVIVAPEYNHGISGALKNAIDFLFAEWNNKSAGFVSYGSAYGVRAVEHLRGVCGEIKIADVRAHVMLSLFTDFENYSKFNPEERHIPALNTLIDEVVGWGTALKQYRDGLK